MTYECEENQWSQIMKRPHLTSKEEAEKACNEDDECLGYNIIEGNYYLLATKIIKGDFTLCVKKSK